MTFGIAVVAVIVVVQTFYLWREKWIVVCVCVDVCLDVHSIA